MPSLLALNKTFSIGLCYTFSITATSPFLLATIYKFMQKMFSAYDDILWFTIFSVIKRTGICLRIVKFIRMQCY